MNLRILALLWRLRKRLHHRQHAEPDTDSPAGVPDKSSRRAAQRPERRRWSPADIAATSLLSIFAVSAACASIMCALRFVTATNGCPPPCHSPRLESAFLVTWGGIATAFILTALGLPTAAWRGRAMWIWPAIALAVLATTTASGLLMAGAIHVSVA